MTFLADTDVMSMANSQEIRVPFVDRRVFGAAFRIPAARKALTPGKRVLRRMLHQGGITGAAGNTVKQGFHLPFSEWLRKPGALNPGADRVLTSSLSESPVFGPAAVALVREYRAGRLDIPWTVPYLLLVTADYCARHSLDV